MDALTHLLVGLLFGALLGPDAGALAVLATVFAVLPDIDTVTWVAPRLRRYLRHRGATHSLVFGVAASLVAATWFVLAGWAAFHVAFAVALVGFLTHVTLDVLNWGCLLLWPFRRDRVEHTVHGAFTWSAPLSLGGIVALEAVGSVAPALAWSTAAGLAGLVVGYFLVRLVGRARWARAHPGRRLVPTSDPFVWIVA